MDLVLRMTLGKDWKNIFSIAFADCGKPLFQSSERGCIQKDGTKLTTGDDVL